MTEPTIEMLVVVSTAQLGEAGAKWLALGGPGATLYWEAIFYTHGGDS